MASTGQLVDLRGFLLLFLYLDFSCSLLGGGGPYRRELSVELNPGLNTSVTPLPPGVGLLHVRALGVNDTLHFLLSNQGAPTLFMAHTNSSSSSVQVDWPAFLSRNTTGSLTVEPKSTVLYSSALVFTRLWEYDDANDTVDMTQVPQADFLPPYELQNFTWSGLDNVTNVSAPIQLCGGDGSPSFSQGHLCLVFTWFESEGREDVWPSLLHNVNSSQVKLLLDGLLPRADHSRFALELQAVSRPYAMDRLEFRRSIDDEYTPSIFKVTEWVSSTPNASSQVLGYTQWKPVAYRKPQPIVEDSVACSHSALVSIPQPESLSGLVRAYYGLQPPTTGINVSFSIMADPLYNATKYLSWTLLVGVGTPPYDSFSPLVIAIMAVGLGLPLIVIVMGGVFVCVRKKDTTGTQSYEPIN